MMALIVLAIIVLSGVGVSMLGNPFTRDWYNHAEQAKALREHGLWGYAILRTTP